MTQNRNHYLNQERHDAVMVHVGSETLLRALWREHPDKLRLAARNGRQVVRP